MQACECVCVSLISTRAAPFSRVFLGTYQQSSQWIKFLAVVVQSVVGPKLSKDTNILSRNFRIGFGVRFQSSTFYERMEDYIERDIPNGATAGEGLFSGNTILLLHTIFVLCTTILRRSLVYFQFPRLPFFYYYYYHKTFFRLQSQRFLASTLYQGELLFEGVFSFNNEFYLISYSLFVLCLDENLKKNIF